MQAIIKEMIDKEPKVMTEINSSYSSAFRFLSQVNTRGNKDEDDEWSEHFAGADCW